MATPLPMRRGVGVFALWGGQGVGAVWMYGGEEGMDDPITVLATIAQATGALKTMADGGFRITFDVPETELAAYVRMHLLRDCRLKLTIEIDDDE